MDQRATPTVVEGRVYALGATGILDCLQLSDGALIWSRDTLKEIHAPNLRWGKASSPLVFDNLVVITGGHTNGPSLVAFHRHDGSPAWKAGSYEVSYSSPDLLTLADKRQVLMLGVAHVAAHDPTDGRVLWEYHWKEAEKALIASQRPGSGLLPASSANAARGELRYGPIQEARKQERGQPCPREPCRMAQTRGHVAQLDTAANVGIHGRSAGLRPGGSSARSRGSAGPEVGAPVAV